jgi:hypothetical protein
MNANTRINFGKLSLAIAMVLGLGLSSLAADAAGTQSVKARAASYGRMMQLGTIRVTAADAEGGKKHPTRGHTAYLGRIKVTPADSDQAHYAAREAARTGAVYLGTVEVTADDSMDARYAAELADAPGTAYLGSIRVTPAKADASLLASAQNSAGHLSRLTVFRIIGALVFGRAGG